MAVMLLLPAQGWFTKTGLWILSIYRTFVAYEEGILTKEETIARLKVKELYNQMTFATEAALNELTYSGQLPIERGKP